MPRPYEGGVGTADKGAVGTVDKGAV